MLVKIFLVLAIASVATAGVVPGPNVYAAAPIGKAVIADDFDPNPQYSYGYSIQDGLTGDSKGHQESRQGDLVQGQYSLVEPDGAVRTVSYTASDAEGFNAVVSRSAPTAVVKAAAPVAKVAGPVGYAVGHAPLAHGPIVRGF